MSFPQEEGSAEIHRNKNYLFYKDASCLSYSPYQHDFPHCKQAYDSPRVSPRYFFSGGVKFLQGEGSAVIHRKKNDLFTMRHLSESQLPWKRISPQKKTKFQQKKKASTRHVTETQHLKKRLSLQKGNQHEACKRNSPQKKKKMGRVREIPAERRRKRRRKKAAQGV